MIKLRTKIFGGGRGGGVSPTTSIGGAEIKWELRPGGMLVQKRENQENGGEDMMITIRVSTVSKWHDISIHPTSTFGELKNVLSILTKLEPHEQRLLFKGKEREDDQHLHMVGVKEKDKLLMLEDPAIKERKMLGSGRVGTGYLDPLIVQLVSN